MNVEDMVQIRIQEAARRVEAARKRRAELDAARQVGLRQRHRAKLARLEAAERNFPGSQEVSPATVTATRNAPPESAESDGRCCPRACARGDGASFLTADGPSSPDPSEVA